MKKSIYFLILSIAFISFNNSLRSQALIADTIFHFGLNDAVIDMIVTDSGDCILAGKMDTTDQTPKNIWVRQLGTPDDTLVEVIWEKIFYPQNASRASRMIWTQDGNFIIAGSWNNNNMILKMSPTGDSLSSILLPGNGDTYFKDVVELPNTDLVVLQVDVDEDLYAKMIRMTSTGSVVWEQEYFDRYYCSIRNYDADSFLVGGYEYHQDYQHLLYGAFNPNGSPYFSNMYQEYYGINYTMETDSAAVYLGNSKEYVTSPSYVSQVVRMTPSGEVEWDVDFTGIGSEVLRDIHIYDNYLLTCSEQVSVYFSSVIVGAITFDGVLASTFIIPKNNPQAVAISTFGNNMMITGRQSNGANGKDVFFMKFNLDSLFVISDIPEYAAEGWVNVYPNPVNDRLYIGTVPGRGEATKASVYSLMGRLEKSVPLHAGTENWISTAGLPEGLYLVMVQFRDAAPVTRKILVVH